MIFFSFDSISSKVSAIIKNLSPCLFCCLISTPIILSWFFEVLLYLPLSLKKLLSFKKLLIRRKQKEPIAYIFKKKDFWKQSFFVNKDVLIPRPETEIIVEEVLKLTHENSSKRFLDVGTGSGCLILSILKERPNSFGTAIDICKKAIKIALFNAKMHHLENKIKFININIDKFTNNKYDFIFSNPPYIDDIKYKRLEINVKQFEPKIALKAGTDGLKIIKKLIFKSKELLKKNGKLVFEIGEHQEEKIKKFLRSFGVEPEMTNQYLNSFTIKQKINRDAKHAKQLKISSTPMIVVDGKYIVEVRRGRSYQEMLNIVDHIVNLQKPNS